MEVKVEPRDSDDLKPTDCILAKIKKEIEEDFAINEALLFDEESSREDEEKEDSVVVKQEVVEGGELETLEKEQPKHLKLCLWSKTGTEGSTDPIKAEECESKTLSDDVGNSKSFVPPFGRDLAQQLAGILPVPTLVKELVASPKDGRRKEVKISRPSLKSFGGNKEIWWKSNVKKWWPKKKLEDLRGKIKGRWTALDSVPKRRREMRIYFDKESGALSRTFKRFGDGGKYKSVGWQREALVGKVIEKRCSRKAAGREELVDRSNGRSPPRKKSSDGRGSSQDSSRWFERRGMSKREKGTEKTRQQSVLGNSGLKKMKEKVVVDVKAERRDCRHQGCRQNVKSDEEHQKRERKLRRYSSTSTMSTSSNASESKNPILMDTSLGLLTKYEVDFHASPRAIVCPISNVY